MLLPVPSAAEVTVQTLPKGVEEQQVGVEAFNYIDRGSESKFRGELITYDLTNIKVCVCKIYYHLIQNKFISSFILDDMSE